MNFNEYDAVLFDWGDTIMKDFPDKAGKMRYWDILEEMPDAKKTLTALSKIIKCYLATSAQDSTKEDISEALKRAGLDRYFTDIFCYKDIGCKKSESRFYKKVMLKLKIDPKKIIMVGNDLENDVIIPKSCGINAILFDSNDTYTNYPGEKIRYLTELLPDGSEQKGEAENNKYETA
jgi:putative hydrolase of the HAD superfamily